MEVKWTGREVDHISPSSKEFKNYTIRLHGIHMKIFTFTFGCVIILSTLSFCIRSNHLHCTIAGKTKKDK